MGQVLLDCFIWMSVFKCGNMQVPSKRGLDWYVKPETNKLKKVWTPEGRWWQFVWQLENIQAPTFGTTQWRWTCDHIHYLKEKFSPWVDCGVQCVMKIVELKLWIALVQYESLALVPVYFMTPLSVILPRSPLKCEFVAWLYKPLCRKWRFLVP